MAKIKTEEKKEQLKKEVEFYTEFSYLTAINEYKERADYYKKRYKEEQKRLYHFIVFVSKLSAPIPNAKTLLRTYFVTPTELESEKIKHNNKS